MKKSIVFILSLVIIFCAYGQLTLKHLSRYLLEKYCKELNEIVSNTYKGVELKIASKIAKAA